MLLKYNFMLYHLTHFYLKRWKLIGIGTKYFLLQNIFNINITYCNNGVSKVLPPKFSK